MTLETITLDPDVHPDSAAGRVIQRFRKIIIGGRVTCEDIGDHWWSVSNPVGKAYPFLPQRSDEVRLAISIALIVGISVEGERRP